MALHILRKVSQATIDELHVPVPRPGEPAKDFLYLDKNKPWFAERYLDDEHPRDQFTNKTIMDGTEGFAVYDDNPENTGVVATFDSFAAAFAARAGAKLTMSVKVDIPEPEPIPEVVDAPKSRTATA